MKAPDDYEVQNVPLPEGMSRPETGVMQFGDDWPGVFIRGDNAFHFAVHLQWVLDRINKLVTADNDVESVVANGTLTQLFLLLRACDVRVIKGDPPEFPKP